MVRKLCIIVYDIVLCVFQSCHNEPNTNAMLIKVASLLVRCLVNITLDRFWKHSPKLEISHFGWNHFGYGFIFSSGGRSPISAISIQQRLRESRDRWMYQMYKLCDFRTVLKLHSNECYKKSIILPLVLLPMVMLVNHFLVTQNLCFGHFSVRS